MEGRCVQGGGGGRRREGARVLDNYARAHNSGSRVSHELKRKTFARAELFNRNLVREETKVQKGTRKRRPHQPVCVCIGQGTLRVAPFDKALRASWTPFVAIKMQPSPGN